ncbi:kinase-like domain-containing protein [Rhizophagus irregularis DAOM 181602=DAOM 197198]|nr:kinase-like domain-containing protein [Rhizophagus irregularis DAOM 181602=DAOM 197198]
MDETPKNLWKYYMDRSKYQDHITIPTIDSTIESENVNEEVVYIGDLEKRKQAYGICGECKEPGTGWKWCQSCNAKRLKDNFKNWTSGNKDIDEFIQQSQLNAVYYKKYLEWIPFEKFQNITYIAEGGFDFLNEIKSHLQIYHLDIVQCFGITQDPNNKDSDTSYTAQTTSANPISECLDVQLSELELNEICQDVEDNIE